MYGCQSNCGWSFDLKVDNSTRKVTPVASKQLPYICADQCWHMGEFLGKSGSEKFLTKIKSLIHFNLITSKTKMQ